MRTITPDEELFLSSLIRYPEIIFGYADLEKIHFSSEFPWLCYSRLISAEASYLNENSPLIIGTDLRRESLISSEEFAHINDMFGCIPNQNSADEAHRKIHEKHDLMTLKNKISVGLSTITNVDELRASMSQIIESSQKKTEEMTCILDVETHIDSAGFDFGFKELDAYLDVEKTDLVVIAARPFSGKTTFAVQLAIELTRFGKIHFWSMEMSSGRIREKVEKYGDRYSKQNFYIRSQPTTTINEIHKQAIFDRPVAIFVDQFNKIRSKGDGEYEQFTRAARGLKELSSKIKTPIFCLAQINRDAQNGRPHLYQLKGTGSIEEECDIAMLLHVPKDGTTNLYLEKNRSGNGFSGAFSFAYEKIYSNCQKIMKDVKQ